MKKVVLILLLILANFNSSIGAACGCAYSPVYSCGTLVYFFSYQTTGVTCCYDAWITAHYEAYQGRTYLGTYYCSGDYAASSCCGWSSC